MQHAPLRLICHGNKSRQITIADFLSDLEHLHLHSLCSELIPKVYTLSKWFNLVITKETLGKEREGGGERESREDMEEDDRNKRYGSKRCPRFAKRPKHSPIC